MMVEKYILNPHYILRHDIKRSYIVEKALNIKSYEFSDSWVGMIHPIQAMVLSFFSLPNSLSYINSQIANFFENDENSVAEMLKPFIENAEPFYTEYNGNKFSFPKKVIVKYDGKLGRKTEYTPIDFTFEELDFNTQRYFKAPLNITLMLNNKCITNCLYCYADKSKPIDCRISFKKIEDIIKQSCNQGIKNISLLGGEVFNYKNWYELIKLLAKYDFHLDFLSTKVPLKEIDILKLKEFKKLKIQISLDSICNKELTAILGTKGAYLANIMNTIDLFEKHNINYQVATVCTKINGKRESLHKMFDFLKNKKSMSRWDVRIAFRSLYSKKLFEKYKLSISESEDLMNYVMELKELNIIRIDKDDTFLNKKTHLAKDGTKSFYGARCSSNYSHFFILPDGNVTFCEQLYWKEKFYIGNILEQSIEEIWNSPASLKWSHLERADFKDNSPCKTCEIFEECYHQYTNKCMPDVLKAYGDENWDFPDPRCIKAPQLLFPIY